MVKNTIKSGNVVSLPLKIALEINESKQTNKAFLEGGRAKWLAYLLTDPAALGSINGFGVKKKSHVAVLIDSTLHVLWTVKILIELIKPIGKWKASTAKIFMIA